MCKYLAVVIVCLLNVAYANECKRTGDCSCEFSDGKGIDLKPMIDSDAQPLQTSDTNGAVYFFHPCKDIQYHATSNSNIVPNECEKGYTLCKVEAAKNKSTRLGELKETKFTYTDALYLSYIKPNSGASVKLVCTNDKKSYFLSEPSTETSTNLVLLSPYACPIMMEDFSKPSTGTVLLIMFFIVVLSYFVIGTSVNAFYLGARGIEMVPHLDFWRDLPSLVREGFRYLQNGCTVPAPDPDSYDAI